jgi:thiol-disulfide isomerase/thioredoxin
MKKTLAFASLLLLAAIANAKSLDGMWRAVLTSPGGELPFGLRFARGGAAIINGPERVKVSSVAVDGNSVTIRFDWYDSSIHATLSADGDTMTGEWTRTVPSRTARMAFRATRGAAARFDPAPKATAAMADVNGIWNATFVDADGASPARGELHQDRGTTRVTGTFLTPTGDDRYLEGSYENGLLRLSTFDGAHAFLFQAHASSDGKLAGDFWQRDAYHATWTATRTDDAGATLPDSWKAVGIAEDRGRFCFRFPDLDGHVVSSDDDRFRGKVVLINVFGSWCPNCNDEAPLLAEWDRKYRAKGLEIVGLAFEFTGDAARDREMVRRFAQRYGIHYTLLLAGVSDKQKASAALPCITRVLAYPTSIFIDRGGQVRKIYSGFAGPGTGAHFDQLRREFEHEITAALAER